ncbi:hypothetical protein BC826DRAFT_1188642 [Russula brevipes]|nr:hypothetical protein BC826DRAFT_1188642 [Russula brevipes]
MHTFAILAVLMPLASALTVNTPMGPVVCQPLQITWSADNSQPPYYLALIPGGQPTERPFKQFPPQQGGSYTWPKVSLQPGTSFTVSLKDGNGAQVYSAPATVQDGSDKSCVNGEVMEGNDTNSYSSANSTTATTGAVAVSHSGSTETSSHPTVAAANTPTSSSVASAGPKPGTAKSSSGSASPSQPPSVKANSVSREISSGAIVGIMIAVGLTSVVVSLVV